MNYILYVIGNLVSLYTLIIFVYVLLSWIPNKSGIILTIDDWLGKICDPYLNLFKRFIPPIGGMLDISPIIAIVVLQLAVQLLYWIF